MAITVKHSKTSSIPDAGDASLVQPSDWNADHTLSGTVPVANGGTGAATLTGYVKGNGTSTMTASSTIPNTDITGLGTASTKDAGAALGVATLDAGGTVPLSQIPASIQGGVSYQGTWNASTNTPTLTNGVGTKGYYYVVSVAGNTNLDGITSWNVGDWAIFNGTVWQKVDNTDAVTSVNGYTGTVVLTNTDVGAFPATSTTGTGNVVLATGSTQANPTISNYENFTPTTAPTYSEGRVWYDSTEKALAFYNDSSALAVHVSQDLIFKVINNTGSTIPNGSPVYITGTSSGQTYPNVALAKADVAATSSVIGLTNGAIANGAFGYVTSQGTIDNVNTSTYTVGQVLYLSPYSAGQLMNTIPPTGITVQVGVVSYVDSSAGHIYVKQTTPLAVPASIITGTLGVDHGGTGQSSNLTAGSIVYGASTTAMGVTAVGTSGQVLTSAGAGTPTWTTPTTGTVTSVAATVPSFLSVTGSPITSSGTLALSYSGTALPVLNGGTGTTTSTGTGSVVLGTRPTMSVTGAGFTLQDATDNTKQVNFSLTSIATGTTRTLTLPNGNLTLASTSGQTFTGTNIFSGTLSATGIMTLNGDATNNINFGTNAQTNTITIGGNAQTAAITVGQATGSQAINISNGNTISGTATVNINAGATASGATSTTNIGTGGLSGSTTNVNIGNSTNTCTTTINGSLASNAYTAAGLITANGGLLVPTGTSATVGDGTSGFTIKNATDATKIANFDLSNLTTGTTYSYQFPLVSGASLATLGNISQTFTGGTSFSPTTASSTLIFGSTSQTGAITLGRSTAAQTVNIATGVNTAAVKTVNIGTGGTGSTTAINIGSSAGSTTTTTINGTLSLSAALPVASGGTGAVTLTGVIKGNGTSAITAATAGTDFVAPATATSFTAQQYFGNVALTDAATIAWAANTAQVATFTFVSSNRTMGAPTGLVSGAYYGLAVIQNSGSNTLTWNSVFKWAGGTAPTLSTAASAKDYFVFRTDGTNLYEQGRSLGVA